MVDKEPNCVLWPEELGAKGLPKKQLERIKFHSNSEDLLTWNVFMTLKHCQVNWLTLWLQTCFPETLPSLLNLDGLSIHLWPGRQRRPTYPSPPEMGEWLRKRYRQSPISMFRTWANKKGQMEGATEIDVAIENSDVLIFVEAKYLSDISHSVTYDPWRDQIARCIDVGSYHAGKRDFFFVLLTPRWSSGYVRNSRLYHYKLREYQRDPDALRVKLPHRIAGESPIDFNLMSQRIGQAYWDDLIDLTDEQVGQGNVRNISMNDWQCVIEDFCQKGLIK
jgi:hypothetical protein